MFKSDFIVSGAEVNLSSDTSPQTFVSSWWIAVLVPILLPPPSSSLTLTLLSTCSARHHTLHRRFLIPSDGLCIATLISLSYPPSFSLSLHRLPSIEISKNRSDFSSIFHNPPFHLIFDHNIHSHSINYIYSFLFFFPLPQYFHSLDRWRAIVILFPSPHSLTSPTPLPSPSSIRTTQSSASIDLLRERSRKSRFRERETSEVEMRSEKEQLGDKLEKGWGGDTLTFSLAQVRSCAISPRGGRVPRPEPRVFFYFEIPSIHHASETRLAPPPPPPRSALPPPANLSFAFFHLSRSSCHASFFFFSSCYALYNRFSRIADFPPHPSPLDWSWSLIE